MPASIWAETWIRPFNSPTWSQGPAGEYDPPAGFDPINSITWEEVHWANDPEWTPPADGAAVDSWRDASGNGRDSEGVTTTRPLFRESVVALNNRSTVEFDGTDDVLFNADTYTLAQPFTVVAVVTAWQEGDEPDRLFGTNGISVQIAQGYPNDFDVSIYAGGADFVAGATGDTGSHLYTFEFDGASSAIGQDDVITVLAASPGASGVADGTSIGNRADGARAGAVQVAFIGVYDGLFTDDPMYSDFVDWAFAYYGIGSINPARMEWDDDSPMLWDDDSEMEWDEA